MSKRFVVFTLGVVIVFGGLSVVPASALTQQEKTTLILELVQKVLELNRKIVALSGTPIVVPPGLAALAQGSGGNAFSVSAACTISRTLALGSRGEDVRCLQRFLIFQNLLASDAATGYFGPLTRAAVIMLQRAHHLEQVGHVGKLTRSVVNAAQTSQPSTLPVASAPTAQTGESGAAPASSAPAGGGEETSPSIGTTSQLACPYCSIGDGIPCQLDGLVIPHGSSRTFYSASTVIYPAMCVSVSQVRTCSYGRLSGSAQYNKASCSVKDATPPSVPTNLSATAISATQINLSWTTSTDQGGSGLAGYKIYRTNTQIATTTATSFQNTGLAPSTFYTYQIAAYDNAGNVSAKSASVTKATLAVPVATSTPVAGYDIIIIAGQSNAVGSGLGAFTDPYTNTTNDARIMQLGRRGAENLTIIPATWMQGGITYDALQHWAVTANRTSMGLAIPFARRYIADGHLAADRKVLIIPAGYGGTSILKWLGYINVPATSPVALYDDMRDRTKTALALPGQNRIVAFLWHQGESDVARAEAGTPLMPTSSVYKQDFGLLVNKVRADFPSNPAFPIIAGKFVPTWDATSTVKTQFETAIGNVLAGDVRGGLVDSSGLEANYPAYTTDTIQAIHFSSAAQVSLGGRYYQMWQQLQSSSDTTAPTVSLTAPTASSTISGTVAITATASDNVAVAGVQFKIDGTNIGAEVTATPYTTSWNTTSTTNGVHTIQAVARDMAGNRATSTIQVVVGNQSGFHCYFTNGIRVCRNASNEAVYSSVPNDKVAYNISTVRDGNTYYTVYHSEHKGAVPPEGGDSITVAVPKTGSYPAVMPAYDYKLWGNDVPDSTLAWYSLDASGNRVSGPGGGGNPVVISGLPGDPYFYVFFLGVADDDRDRLRAENDWRHYLIEARTRDFVSFDARTDSDWAPFTVASAATMRPAVLVDAGGNEIRSNAPKALGATQGLIGSMSYVNGMYHFFYGDYAPDGVSYNIYHRTIDNLVTGRWSAPEVVFSRGTDPKNRTMVRIAKAEGMDRWLVLYGCYVLGLDGTYRQDVCLQYTQNLSVIGAGGLSSLSLTPAFALGFSDLASRSFAQPNLLTDRWGNQMHVNDALNTGELYWSDFNPSQCSSDPRPGCPVYGGDVLRAGWNVKVM